MLIHRMRDHLDEALGDLSKRSRHKGSNDDIWDLRFQWPRVPWLSQTSVFLPLMTPINGIWR